MESLCWVADDEDSIYLTEYSELNTSATVWIGAPGKWVPLHKRSTRLADYLVVSKSEHYYVPGGLPTKQILRTLDGGITYTTLSQQADGGICYAEDRLVALNFDANVYWSTNHGDTWTSQTVGNSGVLLAAPISEGKHMLAVGFTGFAYNYILYYSKQAGTDFRGIYSGYVGSPAILGDTIYRNYSDPMGGPVTLYTSKNDGNTWDPHPILGFGDYTLYGDNVIARSGSKVYISKKDEFNWIDMGVTTTSSIQDMVVWKNSLLLATREGLYRFRLPNASLDWRCYE